MRMPSRPEPAGGYAVAIMLATAVVIGGMLAGAALTGRSLSPMTWYLTRAAGMVLYLLLWLTVMLGLGLTTTLFSHAHGRAVIYSLHLLTTSLSYGFLALHVLTLAIDQTVSFTLAQLVVPFSSSWKEPWTGMGVLAAELTLLIGASAVLRRALGYRLWRALHWLSFPLYALGLAHGIGAGTDSGAWWAAAIYGGTGILVIWLMLYRLLRGPNRVAPRAPAAPPPLDRLSPGAGRLGRG
jgi:sulfoxide reductase heme-binding subunit YedZ